VVRTLVAQAATDPVCGPPEEANWLCSWVLDASGNETLARFALIAGTLGRVVLIIVLAFVATRIVRRLVARFGSRMERRIEVRLEQAHERGAISDTQRFRSRRFQRLHAITGVMRGVIDATIWITAILLVLSELGVRLQPILAGAGLVGIVIGFGAQQLVRDVLSGIAMLVEDQYGVGDWIEVDTKIGQVERVGLRSTAFRDVDGVVHHVLNGYIQRVGNLSQEWARATFDVPVALDADVPAAKRLIDEVAQGLADDPLWGQDIIGRPEIWGVQSFGPQGLTIRVVIPTLPLRNWDVTRQLRERLKLAFDEVGMRMPSQLVELGGQRMGYPVVSVARDELRGPLQALPIRPDAAATGEDGTPSQAAADDGTDLPGPAATPSTPSEPSTRAPSGPSGPAADETQMLDLAGGAPAAGGGEVPPRRDATEELRLRGSAPRPD
jgi:moderate conductance mechanosensitive channel